VTARGKPTIDVDVNVLDVAAYMVTNVPAARLVAVAKAIGEMAPLLWSHYTREQIEPLRLRQAPILDGDLRTRSDAIE
jgi:hypothetical protein